MDRAPSRSTSSSRCCGDARSVCGRARVARCGCRRSRSSARRARFWRASGSAPHAADSRSGSLQELLAHDSLVGHGTSRSRKAVIPAAGLGTRFLPATKAMPKEMLPVVDKPAIQYVVEEAVAAGIDDVLDDHRPQQERAREPLRPGRPSSRRRSSTRATTTELRAGRRLERPGRHPLRAPGRPEGARPRRAARPRSTSATSRSRCCSATTSSTSATRC